MKKLTLFLVLLPFLFCTREKSIVDPSIQAGGRLVFSKPSEIGQFEIWSIQDNGEALMELAEGYEPDVSPDHQSIVFTGKDSGSIGIDLFKMRSDGGDKICLTCDFDVSASYPKWSPDGSQIAFQAGPSGSMEDVWIMDADGSNKVKLTNGNTSLHHWGAEWSNDGKKLSYIKSVRFESESGGQWNDELWTINSSEQKLMSLEGPNSSGKWGPDDAAIAVISGGALYRFSNGVATRVSGGYVSAFDWADRDSLVFNHYKDGVANLYLAAGQAEPIKITNYASNEGIYPMCFCQNGSVAYFVDGKRLYLNTNGVDRLIFEMSKTAEITDICWIPGID